MEQRKEQNFVNSSQRNAQNDYNVIKIRLDPSPIIMQIESYLRGYIIQESTTDEGRTESNIIKMSEPKMNDEGIGTLLNWISGTLNAQVVQGNFVCDRYGYSVHYENYILEYDLELNRMIVINAPYWNINDRDITPLHSFVMMMIIPFMTRLIGNKERDSYSESIRSVESQNIQQQKAGFSLFRKN